MKKLNKQVGKYIAFKLRLKNITYKDIAKSYSLSYSSIAQICNASKRIKRGEEAIAKALGYSDFDILVEEAKEKLAEQSITDARSVNDKQNN